MKKLLLFIALTIFGLGLNAQNVTIDYDGYSLAFRVTNVEPAECKVSGYTDSPTDVIIPSNVTISGTEFNVTSIGEDAFSECSSLTSIVIPNSVTSIGDWVFFKCSSLTSIEIPNSVTSIGSSAFSRCSSLTSIEIPNSVTSIGEEAFYGCSSLTSIVVAEGNTVYDSRENCNAIIETSSNKLIAGCQNTVIPNTVTSIGDYAFSGCSSLTSIVIPNSVTSIGDYAFSGCSSLTSIEIPNSVTFIGDYAFYGCSSLRVIKCHAENVPETESDVFYGCSYGIIICVPENSVEDYKAEYPWNNYYITAMSEISVIEYDGYSLIYIITDEENTECMVACAQEPTMPTSITIPSSVEIKGIEYSVTSIGDYAFYNCDGLTSIEIPNPVTFIGGEAFYGCSSLTSIEIPNSVTSIGYSAFSGCSSLTSIEIPNSVTSIGDRVFSDCSSLTSITFGENSQLTSIGDWFFSYCSSLTSIEIPNSVTYIGWLSFSSCSSLTSIEIPNSVTSIGEEAFSYCSSLTSIVVAEGNTVYDSRENCNAIIETSSNKLIAGCQNTVIPNTVTSIGDYAFYGCSGLTSIEIPNSVTCIGEEAFYGCSSLRVIKCHAENVPETESDVFYDGIIICVPENSVEDYKAEYPWNNYYITTMSEISVIEYDGYSLIYIITDEENTECMVACAQEPTMPTSITIPSSVEIKGIEYSVTSIGSGAFSGCSSLTSIEIPNSVTSIGDWVFSDCSSLTSITFGENSQLTSIGDWVFSDCSSLTSIEIPNSVTFIGYDAFYRCSSLTSIEIPNSVTFIGYDAFYRCSSLTSITFGDNPQLTSIGNYAFDECSSLTSIEIPNSVTSIGESAFYYCSSLTSIEIPNSVTFIGEGAFWCCSSLTSIEIPNSVTSIGEDAFYYCSSLTSIEIPNSVTSIGEDAFSYCSSLTSIEIPNSVTFIGEEAFYYCSSLRVITCYAEDVPETGDYVFDYCPSDMIIYVPEVSLEDYKATSPWNAFTILPLNDEENDPLDAPENLVAEALSTSSIILTWDNVENALSYNVYRDGEMIINVTNTNYTDNNLEYNTEYCYTVTAVRNETESDKSEEVCAKTLGESINELSSSINIYPNPVENELFIATEVRVKEVSIYDVYGRLCCRDASNASTSNSMDTFNVSVQDLEAGVYFVNIKTENGNIVKRFVKN